MGRRNDDWPAQPELTLGVIIGMVLCGVVALAVIGLTGWAVVELVLWVRTK